MKGNAMRLRLMLPFAATAGLACATGAYARYRRDIAKISAAIEAGGRIADTSAGVIEYAEAGEGEPLLMIHGAGGGFDQGLLIARDFGDGYRIIAPSRFGYLRTPVPQDPSVAAQADAHAALLDHLGVDSCIIVGASAGAPSAIEFALRYPARTKALILLVPRAYDPTASVRVDERLPSQLVLRLVERGADFPFWLAIKAARRAVVRFLGVPPGLEACAAHADRARMTEIMRAVLPLSRRVRGITVDSKAKIGPWPLDQIEAPTLIVSAEDDLFGTLPGARFTAEHLARSELRVLPSGGHLMLGQGENVRRWVQDFLGKNCAVPARHHEAA